jgi:cytochrome c oxidase cbb3-type subunit 3
MRIKLSNMITAASALMLLPATLMAEGTAPAAKTAEAAPGNNTLAILIGLSAILLILIGVLANVMGQFSESLLQLYRQQKSKIAAKSVALLLLFSALSFHSIAAEAVKAAPAPAAPMIQGVANQDSYTLLIFITLEFLVIIGLLYNISSLKKKIDSNGGMMALSEDYKATQEKRSWFWDNFNAAVSIEREKDVLLDHDYDGIQELDNSLPPWWKYGFYITIIFAVIYFFRFQIAHTGPGSREEFLTEMAQGEADKAAYLAKAGSQVDENSVTRLTDETSLAAGKEIFTKNCTPCHLIDGGGLVGPNLTDDYWLHGGSIKDIFKTIKYGYQEKGMKSWKDDFSPVQIQQVASYVKSLHGTKPANPKAPQGELYVEAGAPAAPAADNTKK